MSHPYGPPPPQPSSSDGTTKMLGILSLGLGVLVCCGGGCIAGSPFGLFLLGGGGNTDAFGDFARGPILIGAAFILLSLLPLAVGAYFVFAKRG